MTGSRKDGGSKGRGRGSRKKPDGVSPEEAEAARVVMNRALKRLNVLEYLILGLAVGLALAGGALVGWILTSTLGLSFRLSWAASSLLLFIIPGGIVYFREVRR